MPPPATTTALPRPSSSLGLCSSRPVSAEAWQAIKTWVSAAVSRCPLLLSPASTSARLRYAPHSCLACWLHQVLRCVTHVVLVSAHHDEPSKCRSVCHSCQQCHHYTAEKGKNKQNLPVEETGRPKVLAIMPCSHVAQMLLSWCGMG